MSSFLVRFTVREGGTTLRFEARINRPITDEAIAIELGLCNVVETPGRISADETSDYGGLLKAGDTVVGDYFIEPGSMAESVSAQPCGCDPGADYLCEEHAAAAEATS